MAIESINELKEGSKVTYQSCEGSATFYNGIVKSISPAVSTAVFVVYHCDNEWTKYRDYTADRTNLTDLHHGWRD